MISGAHVIIYSQEPDADRALFRDILGLSHVDAGGGVIGVYEPRHERPSAG